MTPCSRSRHAHGPRRLGLFFIVLLTGCAGRPVSGLGLDTARARSTPPRHYAQSLDSASSGCSRNPACYTTSPGEEALIPWLSRSANAVRTATAVMRWVEDAELERVQTVLVRCARQANEDVNAEDDLLRGRSPTQEECAKVVRQEKGRNVTRAMDWGSKKHTRALECARLELAKLLPDNVSVEPRYQRDPDLGKWIRLDPRKVTEWIQLGLTHHLLGSLVPDIVIHASGNPNHIQRIYDFKFPCPANNDPFWGPYRPGHPHHPKTQGKMYEEALLGGESKPRFATPDGIRQ